VKILILGASGTVGGVLCNVLSNEYETYGTYNKKKPDNANEKYWLKYDIADKGLTDDMLGTVKPDIVISSLTGNFENQLHAHERMIKYLKQHSGFCIFLSTANVFDGSPDGCHSEADSPYPFSDYGKYKVKCEEMIKSLDEDKNLIVRLPKILAKHKTADTIQHVKSGHPIYSNLYMNLNTDENVASAVQYCIDINKSGILHLTSHDDMSVDECFKLLLKQNNESIDYEPEILIVEKYCSIFNREDVSALRVSGDNNFYLTLKSIDTDISMKFGLSCHDAISQTCLGG